MKNRFFLLLSILLFSVVCCYSQPDSAQQLQIILPLQVANFEAKAINQNIQLLWVVNSNEDAKSFEVECADNNTYKKIGGRLSSGKTGTASYEFVDALPKRNVLLNYRVKIIAKDGSVVYSNLKGLKVEDNELKFKLKKNPVGQTIDIEVTSPQPTTMQAFVFTNSGQRTISETVKVSPGLNNLFLSSQNLLPGVHRLVLQMGNERKVFSFVKE